MKYKILLLLLMFFNFAMAQKTEKQNLQGEWAVTGWFNNDSIVLKKLDPAQTVMVFNFGDNDRLIERMHYTEPAFVCGTGKLSFNKATWRINKDEVHLDVQGEHFGVDKFQYKIIYTVIQGPLNTIILKKKEVILSEEENYWDK